MSSREDVARDLLLGLLILAAWWGIHPESFHQATAWAWAHLQALPS